MLMGSAFALTYSYTFIFLIIPMQCLLCSVLLANCLLFLVRIIYMKLNQYNGSPTVGHLYPSMLKGQLSAKCHFMHHASNTKHDIEFFLIILSNLISQCGTNPTLFVRWQNFTFVTNARRTQ